MEHNTDFNDRFEYPLTLDESYVGLVCISAEAVDFGHWNARTPTASLLTEHDSRPQPTAFYPDAGRAVA
jgi:hypothetical protein